MYNTSPTRYTRLVTREISIGELSLGGNHPIRLQSMTNTNTMDTRATVAQCVRMIEAGAELVRITAPGLKEAKNLGEIKKELLALGYRVPIVADIHFNPNAAEIAARIVEKVRINPGNYVDKKFGTIIDYSGNEYHLEQEKIHERILPLLKICKEQGTAIRLGTNHGSLSDRIMSRYGDTPEGMVESAMEFIRICAAEGFHNMVLSMKSSNTRVMVQSTRLLAQRMQEEGFSYPLHLGVTEAGEGEDGRIKSAAGIGALLAEGIGDTIRVSLTEAPELEIPVAREIVQTFSSYPVASDVPTYLTGSWSPFEYQKSPSLRVEAIGGSNPPVVITSSRPEPGTLPDNQQPDLIYSPAPLAGDKVNLIIPHAEWIKEKSPLHIPIVELEEYRPGMELSTRCNIITLDASTSVEQIPLTIRQGQNIVLAVSTSSSNPTLAFRSFLFRMKEAGIKLPVVIRRTYTGIPWDAMQVRAAAETGSLYLDGFGDGLWIEADETQPAHKICSLSFGILQATRLRTTKTEYISCPSCGRTLFNLEETTARVKEKTQHLTQLKIGIMGCIVNGPGEMADADYGYVGAGPGKITLYKGKEVIKKGIPEGDAVEALIALIKLYGDWKDPA